MKDDSQLKMTKQRNIKRFNLETDQNDNPHKKKIEN